jgi:hypothetical protein
VATNRPSVLKRQRERKRAEKAAEKREERAQRSAVREPGAGAPVATRDDLEGYGLTRDHADSDPAS